MKRIIILALVFTATTSYAYDSNPFAVESAIYKIEIQNGNTIHSGTGVLIARDKILTNCHVVRNAGTFKVINSHSGQEYPTTLYYNLGNYDACILMGNFTEGDPVVLSTHFDIGEQVWSYGYPQGIGGFGQGVIIGLVNTNKVTAIESGLFCNPGSSGGPLLNVKGQLVGLNFGTRTDHGHDKCLSIPVSQLLPFIQN